MLSEIDWKSALLTKKTVFILFGLLVITQIIPAFIFSLEPGPSSAKERVNQRSEQEEARQVTGYQMTATLIETTKTLLDKKGGYITNDVLPPFIFMDDMPSWEFGALVQIRDLARTLRNDMSRSQTQSIENTNLAEAEPLLNFNNNSWLLPATEGEYEKAIDHLEIYLKELTQTNQENTQFYARADNLREWLSIIQKRLGSLSQRLSASVGQTRVNTDLAGDTSAKQATQSSSDISVKTEWMEIDNVFYEARGSVWALSQFLQAAEIDFKDVLEDKNALISLRQITRELDAVQSNIWSPLVLNGSGFGLVANYSLVLASYISRANAAVIDLQNLLEQG